MGGPRSPFPNWWIRDAAAQVGLTKVEMADGWTQVGLPARKGQGGWTQVGMTVVEMGNGTGAGEVARGGNGGWVDGGWAFRYGIGLAGGIDACMWKNVGPRYSAQGNPHPSTWANPCGHSIYESGAGRATMCPCEAF